MRTQKLIDLIRYHFTLNLNRKTGWGRREVLSEFEIALSSALAECVELEGKVPAGRQPTQTSTPADPSPLWPHIGVPRGYTVTEDGKNLSIQPQDEPTTPT